MRPAALPPPLARLVFLQHDAAAACGPAQEEAKNDVSLKHRQVGRRAGAPIHLGCDIWHVSICCGWITKYVCIVMSVFNLYICLSFSVYLSLSLLLCVRAGLFTCVCGCMIESNIHVKFVSVYINLMWEWPKCVILSVFSLYACLSFSIYLSLSLCLCVRADLCTCVRVCIQYICPICNVIYERNVRMTKI